MITPKAGTISPIFFSCVLCCPVVLLFAIRSSQVTCSALGCVFCVDLVCFCFFLFCFAQKALNTPTSDGLNLKQAIEQQIPSIESNDSSNESDDIKIDDNSSKGDKKPLSKPTQEQIDYTTNRKTQYRYGNRNINIINPSTLPVKEELFQMPERYLDLTYTDGYIGNQNQNLLISHNGKELIYPESKVGVMFDYVIISKIF